MALLENVMSDAFGLNNYQQSYDDPKGTLFTLYMGQTKAWLHNHVLFREENTVE